MREYKSSVVNKLEVQRVTCNCCGKVLERNQFGYLEEHFTFERTWEFGSEYDGETHVIDMCQCCYKRMILNLKISPLTHDKNNYSNFLSL